MLVDGRAEGPVLPALQDGGGDLIAGGAQAAGAGLCGPCGWDPSAALPPLQGAWREQHAWVPEHESGLMAAQEGAPGLVFPPSLTPSPSFPTSWEDQGQMSAVAVGPNGASGVASGRGSFQRAPPAAAGPNPVYTRTQGVASLLLPPQMFPVAGAAQTSDYAAAASQPASAGFVMAGYGPVSGSARMAAQAGPSAAGSGSNTFPEEQKYEVVYPRKLHTQHKRDTQSKYPDVLHYGLHLNGRPLELQLEKTEDLLTTNYTETHYMDDGTPVTISPDREDHCNYQGQVKNDSNSRVSLSVCHGLSGFIMTQEQQLLIEPLNKTESGAHAVYAYQAQEMPKTCGVDHTMYNDSIQTKISFSTSNEEKKAFLRARKYIELYFVADNSMYVKYKRNKRVLQERVYGIVNFVNLVYKPLNIFVALTGLEIWDKEDQFQVVTSANINLDRFSAWRQRNLLPRKPNDNAHLLTNTDFDGATVGLAWIGTLCSATHSTGVFQDHTEEYVPVGATLAHEMGHNLGMDHDGESCRCSSGPCIMEPSLSYNTPREFSYCSKQNYENFLLNNMPLCMKDKPNKNEIVSSAVCGNGFTEVGEDCDCGTEEECTNICCDAKTCKLKADAQCAEGTCCSNCQLKTAGMICRSAKDECDLTDMCDGKSATCPSDRFRANGFPCKGGEGHCYNGKCPTLNGQCQMYWGQGAVAGSDSCFSINTRGSPGFCRYSGVNTVCQSKDVKCGVLFCNGGCTYRNPQVLVEEGTRCGVESVCSNGRCMDIEDAHQFRSCPAKCQENAVCDHEKLCQCDEGWAPPNCNTRTNKLGTIYIVLIVIVLLAVVFIVLLLVYKKFYKKKQRRVPGGSSGVVNPTFNIENQKRQKPDAYPSTNKVGSGNAMYPPQPPASSQKPSTSGMYPTPQPPAASQKPQVPSMYPPAHSQMPYAYQRPTNVVPARPAYPPAPPQAYQRPTNVVPARPAYPPAPPQAMKPNYRR